MSEKTQSPMSEEKRRLAEIDALQREYDVAEQDYEQAKAEATAMKKIAEKKARKLFEFIRSLNTPMPLFEVWRQTPVDELGLPDGIVMLLQEAGYDTIGKLADYTAKDNKLTDIPHIGEAKAKAIEDALERFWAKRKQDGEV
jgi:hypothetical protein